jgi:ketosteroid isomerase-like protein
MSTSTPPDWLSRTPPFWPSIPSQLTHTGAHPARRYGDPRHGQDDEPPVSTTLDFRDGQIVAARDYYDQMDAFGQLGLVPGT